MPKIRESKIQTDIYIRKAINTGTS